MKLVFCSDPLRGREPDPAYANETTAAVAAGFAYVLVDFEALVHERDPLRAVRHIPPQTDLEPALYRGWMLRSDDYHALYEALLRRGLRLITTPASYRHTHYLPEWYPSIADQTPRSVWFATDGTFDLDQVMDLVRPFGDQPLIVKDYVKSRKHEWAEACYIPSASDRAAVERVVRRFVELQGEELNEGLVFREFVELVALAQHPRSGMPLTREFRMLFLHGEPLIAAPYWDAGGYQGVQPPIEHFRAVAQVIESPFFTLDIAQRVDGAWLIVELGDAQVAGLPPNTDVPALYQSLAARCRSRSR